MTIAQKVSKQTRMKSAQSSASKTTRSKIAEKQSRKIITQKQSRKIVSNIKIRKTSVERKKSSKYKTKQKNERSIADDK